MKREYDMQRTVEVGLCPMQQRASGWWKLAQGIERITARSILL